MHTESGDAAGDLGRARKERDFYRKLLELGTVEELAPFLEEALALIVDVAGARRGYIEIGGLRDDKGPPKWWIARGCTDEDVEEIRGRISRGVMAEAVATGRTIVTASALDDPRFKKRGSVRRHRIEAVLCAPIGASPPIGVVYLQDRSGLGAFSEEDRSRAEVFARSLVPLAERLLARQERRDEDDPTRPFRAVLDVARLVGRSPALAGVLSEVRLVAPHDVVVLLTGPTGSGKTDIARVIHDNGPRSRGPFVALNCANLAEQLAESELFGHEKGAFTGADRRAQGKVAIASEGTLFLDEIAELPPGTQAKLLKFLDSKEYYAVGATHASRANVRIIAATHVDLEAAANENRFRRDLFFRLNGFSIAVPSLAERREDIAALMGHLLTRKCEQHGLPVFRFSPGAIRAAEVAEWPGNVRQLESAVEKAALRAHGDRVLVVEREHLFRDDTSPVANGQKKHQTLRAATRAFQAELVLGVLEDVGWNIAEAADRLDVVRQHVYNLIEAFGLRRKT